MLFKDVFGCNDRTGQDETIPQISLFGSGSRVGTGLSQCCPQLSLKIGGTREDVRGHPCPGCLATKHTLSVMSGALNNSLIFSNLGLNCLASFWLVYWSLL
jgi:hypothetical protein